MADRSDRAGGGNVGDGNIGGERSGAGVCWKRNVWQVRFVRLRCADVKSVKSEKFE